MSGDSLRLWAERGDPLGLSQALSGGANPCSRDKNGLTALHVAAWNGHIECVRMLCANHLGVDERPDDESASHLPPVVRDGAEGRDKCDEGGKQVKKKKKKKSRKKAQLATADALGPDEKGVPRVSCVNLQTNMGFTALHLAAWEADTGPQLIQLLLLCGAAKTICDADGMTPLDRAKSRNRGQCEDMLENDNITEDEKRTFREYLDKEFKVQPQKSMLQTHERLKEFQVPSRLPLLPRELEVPEQYILPYAQTNFKARRGPDPLRNMGWAQVEITKNESRRRLLRDSVDRKIALYTGIGKTPPSSRPHSAIEQNDGEPSPSKLL